MTREAQFSSLIPADDNLSKFFNKKWFKNFRRSIFQDLPEFIGLMSRDVEAVPGPLAFGHKYMTGVFTVLLNNAFPSNDTGFFKFK